MDSQTAPDSSDRMRSIGDGAAADRRTNPGPMHISSAEVVEAAAAEGVAAALSLLSLLLSFLLPPLLLGSLDGGGSS